ncbi:hypothetical protein [Formosa sp. PL04]|uniref:hypothetical protein n=1 Tax=Formosa sp. PL04 TaxID=3081755 RepID=UPI002981F168|nr:hypothetical protein [Formosa sp. PL04]MDW5288312.1 hypothetical protein [Formosa sp. PL04]
MKKIIIALALVLGSISLYAAVLNSENSEKEIVKAIQGEYTQVELSDLPTAITEAVAKDYKAAAISKAYINDAKEYKLMLSVDGVIETAYATETGQWITK